MRHTFLSVLVAFPLALTGCGGSPSTVSGTVTLDGTPVEKGAVKFVRPSGGTPVVAVVASGKFETKLAPGPYKVAVYATKAAGTRTQKSFDGKEMVIELTEEIIPEQYNSKSELTEEVKSGAHTVTLDLHSKK